MASKPQPHILGSGPTRSRRCDSIARRVLSERNLPSGQKAPLLELGRDHQHPHRLVSQKYRQCRKNTGHWSLQNTRPLASHFRFPDPGGQRNQTAEDLLISSTVSKTVACRPDLTHRCVFFGLSNVGSLFGTNL